MCSVWYAVQYCVLGATNIIAWFVCRFSLGPLSTRSLQTWRAPPAHNTVGVLVRLSMCAHVLCVLLALCSVLARRHVTRPLNTPLWSACILFAMALSSGPCLHDDIAVHVHRLHVYSGVIKSYTSVFCASYSRTFRIPAYIKPTRVSMHVYPNKRMQVCM